MFDLLNVFDLYRRVTLNIIIETHIGVLVFLFQLLSAFDIILHVILDFTYLITSYVALCPKH